MKKNKNPAVMGLIIFLVFMMVCTVIAKGIYKSGLARVKVAAPERRSLAYIVETNGTVRPGQEYGIYTEPGLRVATIAVRDGDSFVEGDALFQIDTVDLQEIIEQKEQAVFVLKSQQKEQASGEKEEENTRALALVRAREDYEYVQREADLAVAVAEENLFAAREAVKQYEKMLAATVSGGDAAADGQLLQYKLRVNDCDLALQQAVLAREEQLKNAQRQMDDIASGGGAYNADEVIRKAEILALEGEAEELTALLENDGWVMAETAGVVLKRQLTVGERTFDGASILYMKDDGRRIVEAYLSEEQAGYVTVGDSFSMKRQLANGSSSKEEIKIGYLTPMSGYTLAEMELADTSAMLGQTVELTLTKQSDVYNTVVPLNALHQNDVGGYYICIAEEREGILGTEWYASEVTVRVLDSNSSYAAVEGVGINAESQVIVMTTKAVHDGDVIRVLP